MKKIFTTLLITILTAPFLSKAQVAGTTCANPIPLYPQTGCGNTSGLQYNGYYQMENAAGNMVPMTGTSTVNPGCTTDNETTQAVEWLEVTATATSFTINNETSYTGSGAATAEKRDYIVYSGTCGSLTQVACFSEVAGGASAAVTGLTVGQTYLIMVSQSSTALAGCATCTAVATCITSSVAFVPPNDICSGAFALTTNVPFETTNANSTATAADGPAICQSPLSGSVENNVWFSWCAPSTWPVGQTAFLNVNSQICNSTQGLQLSVFAANQTCAQIAAGTATSVICANPGVTTNYSYTFTPSANNCYYINIDGYAGTACTFLIQVGTSTVVCTPPTIAVNSATLCGSGSTTLTATGATSYTWSPATGLSSTTGASVVANPTVTTVYTILGSASGCTGTSSSTVSINAAPAITPAGTNTLCSGSSTSLTVSGASTYTWSPSATLSSSTGSFVTATPTANTTYTIIGTSAAGCTNSAVYSVSVTPTPTVSVNSSTICSGLSSVLTASGATTYSWSPGTNLSATSGTTVSANPTTTTVYTVTGTTNGCSGTNTSTVTVNATPTISVNSSTICSIASTTLTASGATTYSWSPGTNLSATSGTTVSANPTITTVYTVTGTTNGCSGTNTSTVTVNATPTITVNSPTICSGTSTVLTASGGTTYSWTPGTNLSATSGTTVSANPTTTTVYTVTGTTNGCSGTNTSTVTVRTTPTITVNSPTICSGTSTVLTASGGTTYSWTPGTNLSATSGTTVTSNPTTTIIYTVTGTTNGCSASNTSTVTVNSIPTTTASTSGTLTCTSLSVNLNSTLAGVSYTWTTPAGGSVSSANTQSTSASGAPGIYTLNVQSAAGCTFSTTTSVTQNTAAPTGVSAGSNQTLGCGSSSVVTISGSVATPTNATVSWTGPSVSGSTTSLTTTANGSGTYTLTATNPVNGCTVTSTVLVNPSAGAPALTVNPVTNTITCTNTLVTVSISSTVSPATYTWSGTGITSGNGTGTITVNQGGTFNYTLTNTTNSCSASGSTVVVSNTTAPTTTASTSGNLTCSSTSTVDLSSTLSGMNYTWTAPSGGSVASANSQNTSASGAAGVYTLNVVNPTTGCTFSTTTSVTQNTTAPTTAASTSGSLTCSSSSTVDLTSTLSGMNYTWTAPAGGSVASANSQNTSASGAAGVYTLNVIDPATGCTFSTTTSVSQNTVVPTSTASTTGIITCTTSTVSLSASLAGMNYTWTAPAGGSVGSANSQNTSATGVGTYTLTVEDPTNSCTYTTTSTVTDNTVVPTGVSAGSNQTLTCSSTSITLNGSVTSPTNALLDWGTGVCGTQTTAITTACAAGVYTLTATDPSNGCTATSTVEVFPNAGAPSPTISATALTIDCNNASQSVTVTSTPSTNVVYNWNNTPFSASADSSIATFNTGGTYICTVTNTVSGCSTPIQVVVSNNTSVPTLSITGTQTLTCSSPSVAISLTTTPTSGLTYSWSGASIVSGQGTDAIVVSQSGVYTVTVTDGANGCVNTATTQVDADSNVPLATVTASSTNSVITCQNTSVTLTVSVNPSATYSYTWSPSGGNSSTASITISDTYTVLVLNATTGCSTTAFYTVTSNTTVPSITSTDAVIPCGSPSVALGASSSVTNTSFGWTTSGTGTILSGSNTASPVAGATGQYVVTVTDNDNGCTNSQTVNVTQTSITAGFVANPTSGTAPLTVGFTNQSTTPATYSWNFGDPTSTDNTSSLTDPSHVFNALGTYTVLLTVSDGSCVATASVTIDVFENSSIIVPNVFTPNGDKSNDTFKFKTVGIKDLTCDIFNRWGQKLYTIKDVNDSWDGGDAPDGTYFFMLQATGYDGKEYKQQNFLSLFR